MNSSAPRRRWIALGVLVLAVLLVAVDATVLVLALPFISESLNPSSTQLLWIGDSYSFVIAGLLVSMGSLSDRIGRRRLLLYGSAAFGLASLLAAYAPSAAWLIAARALLGVAGATIMPSTLSLIRSLFPDDKERARAIGIWGAAATAGAAAGPLLGGVLLEHFWWGSVFLINIPLVLVLLVLGRKLLPESRDPKPGAWDMASVVLSLVGIIGAVYAVKEAAVDGPAGLGRWDVWVAAVLGVGCLVAFWRRQLRLPMPLLDVRLFAERRFTAAVLAALIALIGLSGVVFFLSQYFQLVRGWSPLQAGLADMPAFAGSTVGALVAASLATRLGYRRALAAGLLAMGLGLGALGWIDASTSYLLIGTAFAAVGLVEGVVYALSTTMVLESSPAEKAGAGRARARGAHGVGPARGHALVGTVLTAVYRSGLVLPAVLPAGTDAAARNSLGGAVEAAHHLPGASGDMLLDTARHAFVHGMSVAAFLAGGLLVAAAVLVWTLLRPRRDADRRTDGRTTDVSSAPSR
ncbi:MFS transporter [Streptacidiphilus fuscans]|uniref:MFS transporter n=2 Tax=Streptacidiphilus fuscans TaxID=2789292 RepID=A0A931FDN3_9ACTN|nr:MFS transporter [Streptacidiphilus fuscans]MBF9069738.1 MFS transporter [Streptacidiphilus fuscans]